MAESEIAFHVGVDWGAENHQVCILNASSGATVEEIKVAHQGAAMRALCQRLLQLAPADRVAVAIESPASPATEPLLGCGVAVFALNPKQLDRFRDRHFPAGSKDDRRDAFVLAASLRTDRHCFRRLEPEEPALLELRELARLDQTLKADLRAYCNRLRDCLLLTFPQILELSAAADEAWIWALLEAAPSAQMSSSGCSASPRSRCPRPPSGAPPSRCAISCPSSARSPNSSRRPRGRCKPVSSSSPCPMPAGTIRASIATPPSSSLCREWARWSPPRCWPRPVRPYATEIIMPCAPTLAWRPSPAKAANPAWWRCAAPAAIPF